VFYKFDSLNLRIWIMFVKVLRAVCRKGVEIYRISLCIKITKACMPTPLLFLIDSSLETASCQCKINSA
jgi:hypothetical protein